MPFVGSSLYVSPGLESMADIQAQRRTWNSQNDPQTILKCPCTSFCNGFYKFWGSQSDPQTILKCPCTSFCNGFYKLWGFQNDPQTILKRSSNARVPVFAMDSTSFEVPRLGTYKILKDWVSCHVLLSGSLQNFSPDLSPKSPPNRLHGKINLEFSEYWPAIGQLKLIF